jgi:hypothetical protein
VATHFYGFEVRVGLRRRLNAKGAKREDAKSAKETLCDLQRALPLRSLRLIFLFIKNFSILLIIVDNIDPLC